MFQKARIKLTARYLAIIMLISIFFSLLIYRGLTQELDRIERIQRVRQELFRRIDPQVVSEAKNRIALNLIFVNAAILVISGGAGYFLAGVTLSPIKEMMDEQSRFITDASHELRTPLTSLKTEIEVVLRDKKISLKSTKDLLKSNLEEVNKIQTLTNYLLSLNKYESIDSEKSEIDLKEVAQASIVRLTPIAAQKKIEINKNLKSTITLGNKDAAVELTSIIIDNAIKYSPQKGRVIVRTYSQNNLRILEVEDFGIGIAEKDLPHIFDRFYRADISRSKEKIDGYGLGLSIAKSIADSQGIQIKVSSKKDGTTFQLLFRIGV